MGLCDRVACHRLIEVPRRPLEVVGVPRTVGLEPMGIWYSARTVASSGVIFQRFVWRAKAIFRGRRPWVIEARASR